MSIATQVKYLNLVPAKYNILLALSRSRSAIAGLCDRLSLRPATCLRHTLILAVRRSLELRHIEDGVRLNITRVGTGLSARRPGDPHRREAKRGSRAA